MNNFGPPDLASAGQALYGDRWQTDVAKALGVDARRVRQWMTGDRPIPPGIWSDLSDLLRERGKVALELADHFAAIEA